jgi:hypothetical protein
MSQYSESSPSPYYAESVAQGRAYQAKNKVWRGKDCCKWAASIRPYLEQNQCATVLDYGCGKGEQYSTELFYDVHTDRNWRVQDYWRVAVTEYDPCVAGKDQLPDGQWDAVISTQVLGCIPDADVRWVIELMASRARKLLFIGILDTGRVKSSKILMRDRHAYRSERTRDWYWDRCKDIVNVPVILEFRDSE